MKKKKVLNLDNFKKDSVEILSNQQSFAMQGGAKNTTRKKDRSYPVICKDGTCEPIDNIEITD